MPSDVYTNAKVLMASDLLEWLDASVTFRALLVTGYTYNHVHVHVSDVIGFEVSDPSYERVDVLDRSVVADVPGDRALLRARNLLYPSLSGVSPDGCIIYKQVGPDDLTPSNDPLICYLTFPATAATGINYLVEFDPDGVLSLTTC
jgi:hypothetical protein